MKLGIAGGVLIVLAVIAAIVGYSSLFTVYQTRLALVVRLGQPVRVVTEPGLNFKVPLIDSVIYVDKRILDLENAAQEVIASDQKRLVVDAFARYRINDALRFYQAVGSIEGANSRLSTLLNAALRRVLGESTLTHVVKDERAGLMARVREQLDREAAAFGITIVDVRIRRADLPEQNSQAVYQRMQTERQREAAEFRANGSQRKQEIQARADRDVTVLLADAQSKADRPAAKAMPSATASSRMPTARTRTSSPSIARCRPMRPGSATATPAWCCGRIRTSSGTSPIRAARMRENGEDARTGCPASVRTCAAA